MELTTTPPAPPAPARLRVNLVRFAPDGFRENLALWEVAEARGGPETTWAEPVTDAQHESTGEDA